METTKIVTKMQNMGRITNKIIDMKFLSKLSKFRQKSLFYKNAIYSRKLSGFTFLVTYFGVNYLRKMFTEHLQIPAFTNQSINLGMES